MFDFSFENILHSNLINFGIMVAILAFIISKLNVGEKIEGLRNSIETSVTDSDGLKEKATKFLEDTQKSVENLPQELEEIKNNAQKTADNMAEKIMQDAHNQVEKFETNAQKNIENEVSKIQDELRKEIGEISLDIAKNNIKEKLNENYDLHRQLIHESIDKLDKVEL